MDKRHTAKRGPALIKAGIRKPKSRSKKGPEKVQTKITDFINVKADSTKGVTKKIDLNKVRFKQLNNNKREISMDELNRFCDKAEQFICFGHEPSNKLGAPIGLNKRHTRIYSLEGKPRSYIFASANLHIWPMPNLTNEDVATALFDTHDP